MADALIGAETTEPLEAVHRLTAGTATVVWLFLVVATILGWLLAGGAGEVIPRGSPGMIAAVVALAGVKIYLVLAWFMGLRRAPVFWHLGAIAWVVATGAVVLLLALQAAS